MKKFLVLLICSLFLLSGCGKQSYLQIKGESALENGDSNLKTESQAADSIQPATDTEKKIIVQVAGQVVHPGVYELSEGDRVYLAIEAAGGLTSEAFDSELNQAAVLEDGQKIYVYSESELEAQRANQERLDEEAGLININKASAQELTALKGVGLSRAEQIVEYRELNGPFSSIEEIKNVTGIGDGIYSQICSSIKI